MISDGKPAGLTVALAAAISEPAALFSSKPPLVSPNQYLARKMQQLRRLGSYGNRARVNPLLDSMRASSPSRRASDAEDHNSWTLHHPSALTTMDEIVAASTGKQIVVFMDYDGTLSPIVTDPDCAFMAPEMREAVKNVAKFFPTAIVSGRSRAKVYDFVRLPELYYAGSHGMDIEGPSKGCRKGNRTVLCQPAMEFLPMIDEVYNTLVDKINPIPGAKVESNKFCVSVHYRCVEEKRWGELGDLVRSVMKDYKQLRLNQGRMVLEIRPTIKWDKGNAVEFLLDSLGYAESSDVLPIYVGDDRTDEDAFKVLRGRGNGVGILVSKAPKETDAAYSLKDPSEVMQFLNRLVEWKTAEEGLKLIRL